TRSSTPPWPGSSALLSFAPALRLTRDSNKSPTTLTAHRNTTIPINPIAPKRMYSRRYRLSESILSIVSSHSQNAARASAPSTPPSTQINSALHQIRGDGGTSARPPQSAAAHSAASSTPSASAAPPATPFSRAHSQPAAPISDSVNTANGQTRGAANAGNRNA